MVDSYRSIGLFELLQFVLAGNVPVRGSCTFRQAHDVVIVFVVVLAHHPVQHIVEVIGRGGVGDEEKAGFTAQTPERHRLADDFHLLGLG